MFHISGVKFYKSEQNMQLPNFFVQRMCNYNVNILHVADVKIVIKSPKRVIAKSGCEKKEASENDGSSCFSPRSLFAVPTDSGGSFLLDPVNFVEESSDQDLLLDVPSNGSFAQAELLHPSLSFGSLQASTSCSSVHPRLLRP